MSAIGFGVQEPRVWAGKGVQWLAGTKFVGRHYSGVSSYKKNLVADLRLTSTRKYFGFGDANDLRRARRRAGSRSHLPSSAVTADAIPLVLDDNGSRLSSAGR
jgi:hypothetical protein